jgi:hypothetical protein
MISPVSSALKCTFFLLYNSLNVRQKSLWFVITLFAISRDRELDKLESKLILKALYSWSHPLSSDTICSRLQTCLTWAHVISTAGPVYFALVLGLSFWPSLRQLACHIYDFKHSYLIAFTFQLQSKSLARVWQRQNSDWERFSKFTKWCIKIWVTTVIKRATSNFKWRSLIMGIIIHKYSLPYPTWANQSLCIFVLPQK